MKLFSILIFILLFVAKSYTESYSLDANAEIIINEEIKIEEKIKESIIKAKGTFTDSLGNYGEVVTLGTSKSDKEKVILDFLLQGINQKGDKFIGRQYRNSLEQEVGVGSFFYISGTGDYKKLIGKKCYYAVKYLNANVFYKHKCD
tara:strand:+ start:205 stop:642 length:438 start_codon:yes stop_codon:yes gene_type:complete